MRMVCHEYGLDYLFKENIATELLLDSPEMFFPLYPGCGDSTTAKILLFFPNLIKKCV